MTQKFDSDTEKLGEDGCDWVLDGCKLVVDGCDWDLDGCKLGVDGCDWVLDGCKLVVDGCNLGFYGFLKSSYASVVFLEY